eukprot:scaffold172784_cov24-Cyclotella_meneghiniana.AAC.1
MSEPFDSSTNYPCSRYPNLLSLIIQFRQLSIISPHSRRSGLFHFSSCRRVSKKLWSENDDRDDVAFWDQQKMDYHLNENSSHEAMFAVAGEEEDDREVGDGG